MALQVSGLKVQHLLRFCLRLALTLYRQSLFLTLYQQVPSSKKISKAPWHDEITFLFKHQLF